jgi:hypothetical protein
MKKLISRIILIALIILCNQAIAINYKDRIFKKDSAFTVFRETQIGKTFSIPTIIIIFPTAQS